MNKKYSSALVAAYIWFFTSVIGGFGWLLYYLILGNANFGFFFPVIILFALIGSIPVLIILLILIPLIRRKNIHIKVCYIGKGYQNGFVKKM